MRQTVKMLQCVKLFFESFFLLFFLSITADFLLAVNHTWRMWQNQQSFSPADVLNEKSF